MSDEMFLSLEEWPVIIDLYRDFLSKYMKASTVLGYLCGCFDITRREKIRTLDDGGENAKAVHALLDALVTGDGTDKDLKSQWSLFDRALQEEYKWIHEILHGKYSKDELEQQRCLIEFFMDDISKHINPGEDGLGPQLLRRKLLTSTECETLFRRCREKGPTCAAIYMISNIHRNSPHWYNEFLNMLMENGFTHLVEHIDPTGYQKRQQGAAMSNTEETAMEVCSGPAHTSRPPLCGASTSAKLNTTRGVKRIGGEKNDLDGQLSPSKKRAGNDMDITGATTVAGATADCRTEGATSNLSQSNHKATPSSANTDEDPIVKELGTKNIRFTDPDRDNSNVDVNDPQEENKGVISKDIDLRRYQWELAKEALDGKNVIISAPTGSGKTHVALKIIQKHLQQKTNGVCKVVFLVNQVALADQQHKMCQEYLKASRCQLVSGDRPEGSIVPLRQLMLESDVMVMTAQILLDALDNNEVEDVCQFSLLVFDECHHTNQKHPFNSIMHHFMAAKYSAEEEDGGPIRKLPQVVGLTASVGVGGAKKQEGAKKHIRTLCAHLDADYISIVIENVAELCEYSSSPSFEQYSSPGRTVDDFKSKMEALMKIIEEKMKESEHTLRIEARTGIKAKLTPPNARGTPQYSSWESGLKKHIAVLTDADAKRFLSSCRRMLSFYNEALTINDDIETEDAVNYLKGQMKQLYDAIGDSSDEIDNYLKDLFEKHEPFLDATSRKQANTNPKLNKLERLLLEKFDDEAESRAIVFVKTKQLSDALLAWMKRRPELRRLRPGRMTGSGSSSEVGGMTKNQQVEVLKSFKEGQHRILVATSVAEEGLDVAKCNLVMRYNYVTNEIAMVQGRGRARAEDSKFVTLASEDKGVQQKDQINVIREMMMGSAIKELQLDMKNQSEQYKKQKEAIQKDEKKKRDFEKKQSKLKKKQDGEVELCCKKCDVHGCLSRDLRTIKAKHHVVIDPDFMGRCIEKLHPKPVSYDSMQMKYKLFCKGCGEHWGNANLYNNIKFPVIKIDAFVVVDEYNRRDIPRKWKDTKFRVQELTDEEQDCYGRQMVEAAAAADAE